MLSSDMMTSTVDISSSSSNSVNKESRNRSGGGSNLQQQGFTGGGGGGGGRRNARNRTSSKRDEFLSDGRSFESSSGSASFSTITFNNSSVGGNGSSKQQEVAALQAAALQLNLPEDMRISKLRRQLVGEKNPNIATQICEKLKQVMCNANNAAFVRRYFDNLAESIVGVIKDGPDECQTAAAEVFGMMGYVMRPEFDVYTSWLQKTYKMPRLRVPMMQAAMKTLELDAAAGKGELEPYASALMDLLKDYLENADVASVFVAITKCICQFSVNYVNHFEPHFTDIVDIVVGWHLETDQTSALKLHCSRTLQMFNQFWSVDAEFTRNLLGQFLEDITVCGEELQSTDPTAAGGVVSPSSFDRSAAPAPELSFASLVGAYNSVLKSSSNQTESLAHFVGSAMLSDGFEKIATVAVLAIPICDQPDLLVHVNEFVILMLDCLTDDLDISLDHLFKLIHLELNAIATYTDDQVLSFLLVLLKMIDEFKATLPLEFIVDIFGSSSALRPMKFSKCSRIRKALMRVYSRVLDIKDVQLLKGAYRQILLDMGRGFRIIAGGDASVAASEEAWPLDDNDDDETLTIEQAACTISFYLTALSTLATSTSSIMAMWALQPSIFELLADKLQTCNHRIWHSHPTVYYAIVALLSSHCCKNNNFISSSSLLNGESNKISQVFNQMMSIESAATSPTHQHFQMILHFLRDVFRGAANTTTSPMVLSNQTFTLLLDWLQQLIAGVARYSTILIDQCAFTETCQSIVRLACSSSSSSRSIQLKCADCLTGLDDFEVVALDIYRSVAELCAIFMCSTDATVRNRYTELFAVLPLNVSLAQVIEPTGLAKERAAQIARYQHWYCAHDNRNCGAMHPQYFKEMIRALAFNPRAKRIDAMLLNAFDHCWSTTEDASAGGKCGTAMDFGRIATEDLRCLVLWAQWEGAQHCVANKLRTALGKPQDTFLRIESIIKEDARILAMKEKGTVRNVNALIANQKHTRLMLGFMEALEKSIYNAAEGTSFALPLPEKPSRTFFHVNASTCSEWFNRIRTAVDLVALHCMEAEMVIRYSEAVLKNLAAQEKTGEPLFEHTLMSHAWALLRNGESDALHGLYIWTRTITKRKYLWVKAAADQAAGHRETALACYLAILQSPDEPKLDRHIRDFIADQIALCFFYQLQWTDWLHFVHEEIRRDVQRVTIPLISITPQQLEFIIEHEQTNDYSNLVDLCDWEQIEKGENISNNFSYHQMLSVVENSICLQFFAADAEYDPELVAVSRAACQNALQECLRTRSEEHLASFVILNHITHITTKSRTKQSRVNMRSMLADRNFGSETLIKLLNWTEMLCGHSMVELDQQQIIVDLRLSVCSIARKEGNFEFCKRALEKLYNKVGLAAQLGCGQNATSLHEICERIMHPGGGRALDPSIWSLNMCQATYETAKWMYGHSLDHKETAIQFAASIVFGICTKISAGCSSSSSEDESSLDSIRTNSARILLTLSEWIQGEPERLLINDLQSPLTRLVNSLPDVIPATNTDCTTTQIIPIVDMAVGKIIKNSVQQSPNLAKAWGAYGNWCYRWGRKMIECRMDPGSGGGGGDSNQAGLRHIDIEKIRSFVPKTMSTESDLVRIVDLLNLHQVSADEEVIVVVVGNVESCSTAELIESELRSIPTLSELPVDQLQGIVDVWRQSHRDAYSYYELSAEAYFRYLQLATTTGLVVVSDSSNGDCSTVTATLRLLRLIVKHALGLQEVLENGLAATPTSPWKVIIPQLFSRLNHHEPYVRKRVSELLYRVAGDSPHLIIFPAVVGSNQEQSMDLAEISMTDDLDEMSPPMVANANVPSTLTTCFNALLGTLSKNAQETVGQVQLLVHELKRITLLWEEMWLVALGQVYSEFFKRILNFESEIRKINANDDAATTDKTALLTEKHRIIYRPLLFVMERLQEMTSVPAETTNERLFQERYSSIIHDTIECIRQPFQPECPSESWHKFKQFYGILQMRSQKRSNCTLKMEDISPVLARLKNTSISMPGIDTDLTPPSDTRLVFIKSVDPIVHILPTKTKPKKLAFHGSDGKRYTYLFKGLEDLHLDERIMQFLTIANSMMSKSTGSNGHRTVYRARHYSVIPLGSRSGLISWVDGVTPIFALYKKWQQREVGHPKKTLDASAKKVVSAKTAVATTTTMTHVAAPVVAPATRPSEMFQNKLLPLLAEHKLKLSDPRKDWPLSVLKRVLAELTAETPRDLLSKELWCYSTNAADWRQTVRNYAQSIAVMSVIGYVIGLGDRHLDNIMIDLSSGDIVHIDYNVCFEKGKTLRVPEKVPFRMTQNLEEALGVTGIEGTFRLACEHVLKSLKKGRETLLTLLEAFVYDPLVDWAIGEDGVGALPAAVYGGDALRGELRQAQKQLEQEVTRDKLTIGFTEIKPEWMRNCEDITHHLHLMQTYLQQLQTQRSEQLALEANRDILSKQLAMVQEAETLHTAIGSHPLNSLSQRFAIYKQHRNEHNQCQLQLQEKLAECHADQLAYQECIGHYATMTTRSMQDLIAELTDCSHLATAAGEFEIVQELLFNSAQGGLYVHSEKNRKELVASYTQQASICKQAMEAIYQYAVIVNLHPKSYHQKHPWFCYEKWSAHLLATAEHDTMTSSLDAYREDRTQFQAIFGHSLAAAQPQIQQIISFACKLHASLRDDNFKMQSTCQRLEMELDSTDPMTTTTVETLSQLFVDTKQMLANFRQLELGDGGVATSVRVCAIAKTLCDLNGRLLMVEKASAAMGENLIDFSMNGKWFVDELYALVTVQLELATIVGAQFEFCNIFRMALMALTESQQTFGFLRHINSTFSSDILWQLLHGILSEDASILDMISAVSTLQDHIEPIGDLLAQLDLHIRSLVLNGGPSSPHDKAVDSAKLLRDKMNAMRDEFERDEQTRPMAGGQLFLAFYGLFAELEQRQNQMLHFISEINMPIEWRRIDQIMEASNFAAMVFNPMIRSVFVDILIVKRLETMIDIFTMCLQIACAYKGNNGACDLLNADILVRPVRKFIADNVRRLQLGTASFATSLLMCSLLQTHGIDLLAEIDLVDIGANPIAAMDDLCTKFSDNTIKKSGRCLQQTHVTQCVGLCQRVDMAWRKWDGAHQMQRTIHCQSEQIKRTERLLSAYLWMFEENTATAAEHGFIAIPPIQRSSILFQLRGASKTLIAWRSTTAKIRQEINDCVMAIRQRLKWAVGANPALLDLDTAFATAINDKREQYDRADQLAERTLASCQAVLRYEMLRLSTNEAIESEVHFFNLVTRWEKSGQLTKTCRATVSPVEEALVELLDPEGNIDHVWCNNVATIIDDMTNQVHHDIDHIERAIHNSHEILHNCSHKLRSLMANHHRLATDVRTILRSSIKVDGPHVVPIKEYLRKYKCFLETISELHGHVLSKDFTEEVVDGTQRQCERALCIIADIFGELFQFEQYFNGHSSVVESSSAGGGGADDGNALSSMLPSNDVVSISPLRKNPKGTQTEQKRNAYAVSVWRRIRMKLEGRDPDPTKRCTVAEQVDWMIREARNPDNLAVLYEGWTPWV